MQGKKNQTYKQEPKPPQEPLKKGLKHGSYIKLNEFSDIKELDSF